MLRRVALVTWTVKSRQTDPVASPTSSFDLRSQIWPLQSFLVLNSEPKIFQNLHTSRFTLVSLPGLGGGGLTLTCEVRHVAGGCRPRCPAC